MSEQRGVSELGKFIVHLLEGDARPLASNPNFPKIPTPTEIMTSDKKVLRWARPR
jgi:hypothetical protein